MDENENIVAEETTPAPPRAEPIIPEVMPDEKPAASTGAVMPMSEWNKLYQGHLEFKTGYVGRELSITDRRAALLSKLDTYDKMLETMNAAVDGEVDRLTQFKKERFGA